MTQDDVLFGYRLQLFDLAARTTVAHACRTFGVHRSTYYRWKAQVDRQGLEMLRPRERRRPAMPNQLPQVVEERIVAFALGHPGLGPRRIAAMLTRSEWGALVVSPNGVYKALRRHGLSTRAKRLSLIAGYRAPYEPPRDTPPEPYIHTGRPGELVGVDCFYVGRLHGTKGAVWQLTAIDTYSSFAWGELVRCEGPGPDQAQTSRFAQRVARALRHAGWRLERVLTDNGNEFQSDFAAAITTLGARQTKDPRRAPTDQRPRRAPASHHPRRMLAPSLRALPLPALPRPATRTRRLPHPLRMKVKLAGRWCSSVRDSVLGAGD
jgi:transposase